MKPLYRCIIGAAVASLLVPVLSGCSQTATGDPTQGPQAEERKKVMRQDMEAAYGNRPRRSRGPGGMGPGGPHGPGGPAGPGGPR